MVRLAVVSRSTMRCNSISTIDRVPHVLCVLLRWRLRIREMCSGDVAIKIDAKVTFAPVTTCHEEATHSLYTGSVAGVEIHPP